MRRTKILATLGPASWDAAGISRLVDAGADAFRLNFSHGTDEEHRALLRRVHALGRRGGREPAIVADLQGPKIRIGDLREPQYRLTDGSMWVLDTLGAVGDDHRASVSLPDLPHAARPGDPLLVGDGTIELVVESVGKEALVTRVVHGGVLSPHAGLFLPRARLRTEILGPKDRADLALALEEGVDFLALSFVRDAQDVLGVRRRLRGRPESSAVGLIAKIERAEALHNIEGILAASDGIMVARGDLGIEVPLERLATEQKRLVAQANAAGKFAIVATQMLLSMVSSPRPSRAEATDVANAVLDGADALMLSEESAVGHFPVEAVAWLDRIARATEVAMASGEVRARALTFTPSRLEESVAESAVRLASDARAAAIVTPTHSGRTARLIACRRPATPILALTSQRATRRQLALVWGVTSLDCPSHQSLLELRRSAQTAARKVVGARRGDRLVLTAGYPIEGRPTNLVTVMEVDGVRAPRRGPEERPRGARRGSGGPGQAAGAARA